MKKGKWTHAKNARRCNLVDKEIDANISVKERKELEQLQAEMLTFRRKISPFPNWMQYG